MDIFMEGYRKMQLLADDKHALEKLATLQEWRYRHYFTSQLLEKGQTILVTNPDMEIVFASSNLIDLSGYQPKEVLGHTPALFQGAKTNNADRTKIKRSIEKQISFEVSVVNYRKNGSLYRCHIKGFPMFNRKRDLVNYIAIERELGLAA